MDDASAETFVLCTASSVLMHSVLHMGTELEVPECTGDAPPPGCDTEASTPGESTQNEFPHVVGPIHEVKAPDVEIVGPVDNDSRGEVDVLKARGADPTLSAKAPENDVRPTAELVSLTEAVDDAVFVTPSPVWPCTAYDAWVDSLIACPR